MIYTIREVMTTDEHVKGAVRKLEVVPADDPQVFEPISSHFTLDDVLDTYDGDQVLRIW